MKKIVYILIPIVFVFIIFSCSKQDKIIDSNLDYRLEKGFEKANVMNDISTFSKALSRGLILDNDLRVFLKNSSIDESNSGFKEILLNCIKSEDIGKGASFEEELDSLIRYYSKGRGSVEVINNILSEFPTICINIPDKFTNIDWDTDDLGKTPAVVYYTPDTIVNFNGAEIQTDYFTKEKTIYYLNLKVSEGYLEVDLASGEINKGQLNLEDFISDLSDSCKQEVMIYLNTIIDNCKKYDNKVIFKISKLYEIINNCDQVQNTTETTEVPPPLCLTDPIRDVDDEHYTYNYWEGLEFMSFDAINYLNNQPGGEKYFTFAFIWANIKDGGQQKHDFRYHILASDMYRPPTYFWSLSDCDDDEILSGSTYNCAHLELQDPGEIKHYSFPEEIGTYFFSLSDSRWYLNDVGKFFNLEIVEYDPVTTSTNSSTSNAYKSTINFTVPLYTGSSAGWSYTESRTVSSSTNVIGAAIVPLGQSPIDWCDQEEQFLDYPWGNLIKVRTGCDVLEY